MSLPWGRRCEKKNIECYLTECNTEGKCMHQALYTQPGSGIGPDPGTSTLGAVPFGITNKAANTTKQCHTGAYYITTVGGKSRVFASREAGARRWAADSHDQYKLHVKCLADVGTAYGGSVDEMYRSCGPSKVVSGTHLPPGLEDLKLEFAPLEPIPLLHLHWEDYDVMPLDREWWLRLMEHIARLEGDVLFYCQGGHGRTGTAVAIVAALSGVLDKDECPVEYIRRVYCRDCVETKEQMKYIQDITGVTVKEPEPFSKWGVGLYDSNNPHTYNSDGKQLALIPGGYTAPAPTAKKGFPTLSLNQYRKHRKLLERQTGQVLPNVNDLPDGFEVQTVDGHVFEWDKIEHMFEYISTSFTPLQRGNK